MGVESYLVRLTGHHDVETVGQFLTLGLGAQPDHQSRPSGNDEYFVLRDGRHVVEFELAKRGEVCELSIRFAICHPKSIDDVFVSIVTSLIKQLQMTATICELLPVGTPSRYDAVQAAKFATYCRWSIEHAREQWRRQFGSEEAGVSVSEACRKFYFGDKCNS